MSAVEDTIVELLLAESTVNAIVGERIHPIQFPDAPTYPAIVVNKASGVGQYDLAGDVGVEDARVQVDLYVSLDDGDGKAALTTLRDAVRRFLTGRLSGPADRPCAIQQVRVMNDLDLTETATERSGPRIRRRMLDLAVWNTEV